MTSSGRLIYDLSEPDTGACNYWMTRIDSDTGKRLEAPRRLTNWPSFCVASGSVSNDDKNLTFASWTGFFTTYVADLEVGGTRLRNVRHFTQEDSDNYPFAWAPDSKSVIVARHHAPDNYGVYRQALDSDTPGASLSPDGQGWLNNGIVSPDGKWLTARIWRPGGQGLPGNAPQPVVRFPISGGNPETILQNSGPTMVSCAKAPSTMCVIAEEKEGSKDMIASVFDPITGRGPELARFDLDRPIDETNENMICAISPDGNRLAIARNLGGPIEIYSLHGQFLHGIPSSEAARVSSADGQSPHPTSSSLGRLLWFAWTADGKGFFVTRKTPGGANCRTSIFKDTHNLCEGVLVGHVRLFHLLTANTSPFWTIANS